ncbi:MAG: murein biosynthesis integral membrane protein MurJ [Candidatus Magasanikbacteria bacterium]|nr:murein biosynthesis integral membrane protein MurJ [Candidatus Magasanikbacteria bacterium]
MLRRLLTAQTKTITGAAVVIGASTFISRLIGLGRDRILAHYFGTGPVIDAYYAAFKIPDLIYNLLIVGALTVGFIPTFTKLFYQSADKTPAWRLTNSIVNIVSLALLVVCGIGVAITPYLSRVIAPGFSEDGQRLVVVFTRIMLLSPILLGISMVMGGILQSLRQFLVYSIAPIFYNIGIIIGALVFVPLFGVSGLAWGVVLGAAAHMTLQIYSAGHSGYRWRPLMDFKNPEVRLIGKLMVPRTLGLAMTQVNNVVVTMLGSFLPVGSVAVYNYANNLQAVPTGIIAIPFALAVFPLLAAAAAERSFERFVEYLGSTTRQIFFLTVPAAILILMLRAQIVRVVLGSGEFDWTATIATANALAFFALGLLAQALIPLYARAFYALSDTKTPFVAGLISELFSIIAALVLMKPLGVAGLALASAIGATINIILLVILLRQKTRDLELGRWLVSAFKISVAGGLMAIMIQILKYPLDAILDLSYFYGILLQGLISGSLGLLVYGLLCRVLKLEEMIHVQSSLKKRWLRIWHVPAGIDEAEGL